MSPQHWFFRVVTIITHPVFVILWIALTLLFTPYYYNELLSLTFTLILLIPVLVLVVLTVIVSFLAVQLKWVEDILHPNARHFLLTIYLLLLFVVYLNYHQTNLPAYYTDFVQLALIYTLGSWIVLFKWNHSFHVYGWISVFFIFLYYQLFYKVSLIYPLIVASVLTGLVASLRLWQEEHIPVEIMRSLILATIVFIVTFFLKHFSFWL
ncbi:MAG: hypothetical protein N2Z72_08585 [Bacteroidales bacterium]|nr:hypothetical protein [Bacteroidales bacterium]